MLMYQIDLKQGGVVFGVREVKEDDNRTEIRTVYADETKENHYVEIS